MSSPKGGWCSTKGTVRPNLHSMIFNKMALKYMPSLIPNPKKTRKDLEHCYVCLTPMHQMIYDEFDVRTKKKMSKKKKWKKFLRMRYKEPWLEYGNRKGMASVPGPQPPAPGLQPPAPGPQPPAPGPQPPAPGPQPPALGPQPPAPAPQPPAPAPGPQPPAPAPQPPAPAPQPPAPAPVPVPALGPQPPGPAPAPQPPGPVPFPPPAPVQIPLTINLPPVPPVLQPQVVVYPNDDNPAEEAEVNIALPPEESLPVFNYNSPSPFRSQVVVYPNEQPEEAGLNIALPPEETMSVFNYNSPSPFRSQFVEYPNDHPVEAALVSSLPVLLTPPNDKPDDLIIYEGANDGDSPFPPDNNVVVPLPPPSQIEATTQNQLSVYCPNGTLLIVAPSLSAKLITSDNVRNLFTLQHKKFRFAAPMNEAKTLKMLWPLMQESRITTEVKKAGGIKRQPIFAVPENELKLFVDIMMDHLAEKKFSFIEVRQFLIRVMRITRYYKMSERSASYLSTLTTALTVNLASMLLDACCYASMSAVNTLRKTGSNFLFMVGKAKKAEEVVRQKTMEVSKSVLSSAVNTGQVLINATKNYVMPAFTSISAEAASLVLSASKASAQRIKRNAPIIGKRLSKAMYDVATVGLGAGMCALSLPFKGIGMVVQKLMEEGDEIEENVGSPILYYDSSGAPTIHAFGLAPFPPISTSTSNSFRTNQDALEYIELQRRQNEIEMRQLNLQRQYEEEQRVIVTSGQLIREQYGSDERDMRIVRKQQQIMGNAQSKSVGLVQSMQKCGRELVDVKAEQLTLSAKNSCVAVLGSDSTNAVTTFVPNFCLTVWDALRQGVVSLGEGVRNFVVQLIGPGLHMNFNLLGLCDRFLKFARTLFVNGGRRVYIMAVRFQYVLEMFINYIGRRMQGITDTPFSSLASNFIAALGMVNDELANWLLSAKGGISTLLISKAPSDIPKQAITIEPVPTEDLNEIDWANVLDEISAEQRDFVDNWNFQTPQVVERDGLSFMIYQLTEIVENVPQDERAEMFSQLSNELGSSISNLQELIEVLTLQQGINMQDEGNIVAFIREQRRIVHKRMVNRAVQKRKRQEKQQRKEGDREANIRKGRNPNSSVIVPAHIQFRNKKKRKQRQKAEPVAETKPVKVVVVEVKKKQEHEIIFDDEPDEDEIRELVEEYEREDENPILLDSEPTQEQIEQALEEGRKRGRTVTSVTPDEMNYQENIPLIQAATAVNIAESFIPKNESSSLENSHTLAVEIGKAALPNEVSRVLEAIDGARNLNPEVFRRILRNYRDKIPAAVAQKISDAFAKSEAILKAKNSGEDENHVVLYTSSGLKIIKEKPKKYDNLPSSLKLKLKQSEWEQIISSLVSIIKELKGKSESATADHRLWTLLRQMNDHLMIGDFINFVNGERDRRDERDELIRGFIIDLENHGRLLRGTGGYYNIVIPGSQIATTSTNTGTRVHV